VAIGRRLEVLGCSRQKRLQVTLSDVRERDHLLAHLIHVVKTFVMLVTLLKYKQL